MGKRVNGPQHVRFWAKVDRRGPSECWLWTGATGRFGHGRFWVEGETVVYASRYSFELVNGPAPRDKFVCHHCDVPACVNPAHLYLGTAKSNGLDASARGRHRKSKKQLTESQRRECWELCGLGLSYSEVGKRMDVSPHTVRRWAANYRPQQDKAAK